MLRCRRPQLHLLVHERHRHDHPQEHQRDGVERHGRLRRCLRGNADAVVLRLGQRPEPDDPHRHADLLDDLPADQLRLRRGGDQLHGCCGGQLLVLVHPRDDHRGAQGRRRDGLEPDGLVRLGTARGNAELRRLHERRELERRRQHHLQLAVHHHDGRRGDAVDVVRQRRGGQLFVHLHERIRHRRAAPRRADGLDAGGVLRLGGAHGRLQPDEHGQRAGLHGPLDATDLHHDVHRHRYRRRPPRHDLRQCRGRELLVRLRRCVRRHPAGGHHDHRLEPHARLRRDLRADRDGNLHRLAERQQRGDPLDARDLRDRLLQPQHRRGRRAHVLLGCGRWQLHLHLRRRRRHGAACDHHGDGLERAVDHLRRRRADDHAGLHGSRQQPDVERRERYDVLDDVHDDKRLRHDADDSLRQRDSGQLPVRLHDGHGHDRQAHDHRHGIEPDPHLRRCRTGDHAVLRRVREQPEHGGLRHAGDLQHGVHRAEQRRLRTRDELLRCDGPQLPVHLRAGQRHRQQKAADGDGHEPHRHLRRPQASRHAVLVHGLGQQPGRDHGDDHRARLQFGHVLHLDLGGPDALDGLRGRRRHQLLVRLRRGLDHDPAAAAHDHGVQPDGRLRRSGPGDHAGLRRSRQCRDRGGEPDDRRPLRDRLHRQLRRRQRADDQLLGRDVAELRHLVHPGHGHGRAQAGDDHGHEPDRHLRRHHHDAAGAADRRRGHLAHGGHAAGAAGV